MMRMFFAVLAIVFGFTTATPSYAACQNKVGGVCLDKKVKKKKAVKKKAVRKKKSTRKKSTRKKAVAKPAPARVDVQSACIEVKERVMPLQQKYPKTRIVQYIHTNKCDKSVLAYLRSSPCGQPVGYFQHKKSNTKFVGTIKPKSRKTFSALQSRALVKSKKPSMKANYYFSTEPKSKRGFPKWSSGC